PRDATLRHGRGAAGRAAGALPFRDGAGGRDPAQVLTPVRLHDHVRGEVWIEFRRVVLAPVALEAYFDNAGHGLCFSPFAHRFKPVPPLLASLVRTELVEFAEV